MTNTKNANEQILASAQGFLVGDSTLAKDFRDLAKKSRAYRKESDISIPVTAQFSALILEHATTQPLGKVKSLLRDWKLEEVPRTSWNSLGHPDTEGLTESQKILQLLADHLITCVCEEHSLSVKASYRSSKVHGSQDSVAFQLVEQAKAEVIGEIHTLTSKVEDILKNDLADDSKSPSKYENVLNVGADGYESKLFRDFNEEEFELALCAVLLAENLRAGIDAGVLGIDVEESVHSSVVKIKNMFKILDVEE